MIQGVLSTRFRAAHSLLPKHETAGRRRRTKTQKTLYSVALWTRHQTGAALLVLEPLEVGLDKYVDITIHHPFNISDLKIGPMVLHELVRVEYI
jgi:hypothetical protein